MNKKKLIPAILLFLSILSFSDYAQQSIEEQMKEVLKFWVSPISLNWQGNANISKPGNNHQKLSGHKNYANRKMVFRHLILGYFPCNRLIRNNEQRAGGDML